MNTNNIVIGDLFSFGWAKTKENFWYLLSIFAIGTILGFLASKIALVSFLVQILVDISGITVVLIIARGTKATYDDLFNKYKSYKVFLNYFLATILTLLIIMVGFICLIVPGIYLAVRLQFVQYLIVDKEDLGVIDALKLSMQMTKGRFWSLFGFMISILLLNLLGLLLLVVGLLVTTQITMLAYSKLYLTLMPDDLPLVTEPKN